MIRSTGTPSIRGVVPRRADPPINFLAFYSRRRLGGSISPTVVNALASSIQNHEGYYPGSLAYQNNNPGNLIFVGQPGATAGAGGFARWPTYDLGLSALKGQITLDADRGTDAAGRPIQTMSDLISSWAPSSDPRNNTPAYIAAVAADTGYDPNAPLGALGTPDYSIDVYLPAGSGGGSTSGAGSSSGASFPDLSAGDGSSSGGGGFSLPDFAGDPAVDLSAIGLPASTPALWIGAAALLGGLLIARAL